MNFNNLKTKASIFFGLIAVFVSNLYGCNTNLAEADVQRLFPNVKNAAAFTHYLASEAAMVDVPFTEHSIVPLEVPNTYKTDISAGYNFNKLTETHQRFLAHVTGKDVLEIGAGQGFFTGKISAVAKNVHAVELSKTAGRLIVQTTKNYKKYIKESAQAKISVSLGNILNDKITLSTYDAIAIFNVLHYMTPTDAANTLKRCQARLNNDGLIYIMMNAPGSHLQTFLQYKKAKKNGLTYPGYICFQNEAVWGYDAVLQQTKPEVFMHGSENPAKTTSETAGEAVDSPTIVRTRILLNTTTQSKISTQSMFYGDRDSMLMLLDAANLEAIDIYYETGMSGIRVAELELEHNLFKTYNEGNLNLCVVAKQKGAFTPEIALK